MNEAATVVFGCWARGGSAAAAPAFLDARAGDAGSFDGMAVVVGESSCEAVPTLLERGAVQVFLAGASPGLPERVAELARQAGGEHVGVWADAVPMEVRWRLECESNADFKTMAPSMPEACWVLLAADGERTGIRVDDWLQRMFDRGATAAIVGRELANASDDDLNVCAGLVERFGDRLWIAPSDDAACDLAPWIEFGGVRRFVLAPEWHAAICAVAPEKARAA